MLVSIGLLTLFSFASNELIFTDRELKFIEENPVITLGVDPEFMPFEFISSTSEYTGLANDYIEHIENETGLTFQVVRGLNWETAYDKALLGEIDVLPCVSKTEERQEHFLFSSPYYNFQRVIVINDENTYIKSQEDLRGLTIAVQENSSHHSYLKEFQDYELHTYTTVEEAISAVAINKDAAFIGNLATTQYIVNSYGISHLKYISYQSETTNGLHFAIREDWPELEQIINKSLASMTEEQELAIQRKWIGMEQEVDYSSFYRILIIIGSVLGIVILVSGYWIQKLRSEIEKRKAIEGELIIARDEAKAANYVKSHFLARMSHEIRTPLNGITGTCYLLSNTELNRKQRAHLERIKQASVTMLGIINDILDFSKVESGKVELEERSFGLDSVIKNVLNIVAYKIEEKKLDFSFIRDPELPNFFIGDAKRLEQVLMNIINNGIKFTEVGSLTLSVNMLENKGATYKMAFCITDTGIGIPKEQIENLFEAFTQEDSSISRRFGGTGLGLSISKNMIALMGGTIEVESTVGVGSSFVITLSLQQDMAHELSVNDNIKTFENLKAIILNKTGSELNLMHSYLASFGINAELTTSVEQVMSMLVEADKSNNEAYDLVVVDYETPKVGMDLVYQYLDEQEIISYVPKVLVTLPFLRDDLSREDNENHIAISKPIFPSALLDALLNLFDPTDKFEKHIQTNDNTHIKRKVDRVYNVLVVEDNKTNQVIAESLLSDIGINVALADNGAAGVSAFEKDMALYDLILMDLHMPVLNGYEATKAIRAHNSDIPIVALTADAISGVEEKCRAFGFTYFISKPFDPDVFLDKVLELLVFTKKEKQNLWDKSLGLKMLGGNEKLLEEVLNIYVLENEKVVEELSGLVAQKSFEEAARLIHKVKSSTGTIGAESVRALSSDLQLAFENGNESEIAPLHEHFLEVFSRLIEEIRER